MSGVRLTLHLTDYIIAQFCLLEQYLPDGPSTPSAQTMIDHFIRLQSPLKSAVLYPSLRDQQARFTEHGWEDASIRSLWQMWADDEVVPPSIRQALDRLEPFDEWEEFNLFASHYFILLASNELVGAAQSLSSLQPFVLPSSPRSDLNNSSVQWMSKPIVPLPSLRRYGASFVTPAGSVVMHGGQGTQGRLSQCEQIAKSDNEDAPRPCAPNVEAMCHTITKLGSGDHVMVGGMTSPDNALRTCFRGQPGAWRRVQDLPLGRYRHCALPAGTGLVVFGGKHDSATIAEDWLYFDPVTGWSKICLQGTAIPRARFGASATAYIDPQHADIGGVMLGGINCDGHILCDVWSISQLEKCADGKFALSCK